MRRFNGLLLIIVGIGVSLWVAVAPAQEGVPAHTVHGVKVWLNEAF